MTQESRFYTLFLIAVFMLWSSPGHAAYGVGSGCPVLAVPVLVEGQYLDDWAPEDYRELYPASWTTASVVSGNYNNMYNCVISAGSGTYYDKGHHKWVLDSNLTCSFTEGYGDFRAGDY